MTVGIGTIAELARQGGADLSEIARRHRGSNGASRPAEKATGGVQAPTGSDMLFRPATRWAGRTAPQRRWLVSEWIPAGQVTMLGGDGGVGKSLLALQLAVAKATGERWIGQDTGDAANVLYLSAEDDDDELHRRCATIAGAQDLAALGKLYPLSMAAEGALLAVLDRSSGVMVPSPLFNQIRHEAAELRPELVVLDTLADLHSGQENERSHARQVITILRSLAMETGAAVVTLAHPSLTGIASGSGLSGSTAWNNSVRSRLYLERIQDEGFEPNPDARILRRVKSNYSSIGDEIKVTWREGVFHADQPEGRLDRAAASAKATRVFLKILDQFTEQGRHVSVHPGNTYAPSAFAKSPHAEGCTKQALTAAMEVLLAEGKIKNAPHGRASKERFHIERVTE